MMAKCPCPKSNLRFFNGICTYISIPPVHVQCKLISILYFYTCNCILSKAERVQRDLMKSSNFPCRNSVGLPLKNNMNTIRQARVNVKDRASIFKDIPILPDRSKKPTGFIKPETHQDDTVQHELPVMVSRGSHTCTALPCCNTNRRA